LLPNPSLACLEKTSTRTGMLGRASCFTCTCTCEREASLAFVSFRLGWRQALDSFCGMEWNETKRNRVQPTINQPTNQRRLEQSKNGMRCAAPQSLGVSRDYWNETTDGLIDGLIDCLLDCLLDSFVRSKTDIFRGNDGVVRPSCHPWKVTFLAWHGLPCQPGVHNRIIMSCSVAGSEPTKVNSLRTGQDRTGQDSANQALSFSHTCVSSEHHDSFIPPFLGQTNLHMLFQNLVQQSDVPTYRWVVGSTAHRPPPNV